MGDEPWHPRAAISIQAHATSRPALLDRSATRWRPAGPGRADPRPWPVSRTPFLSVTADHGLCRAILRDNRFKVTIPANMGLPRPITWLIRRTDPQLPNPAEPPSMLQVDPPQRRRYRPGRPRIHPARDRRIAHPNHREDQRTVGSTGRHTAPGSGRRFRRYTAGRNHRRSPGSA